MEQFVINAKTRKESGKKYAKQLREKGLIPAVAYDEAGKATMLEVDAGEFSRAWRSITKTTLITLNIDGNANQAYIKDTEYDIKSDKNLHADFHVVSGTKAITTVMKVHYSGTPAGVLKGGFMVKHVPDVKLKALPADMPQTVVLDVSKAEIGTRLTVKDLGLSDRVTVVSNPTALLVSIAPPKK